MRPGGRHNARSSRRSGRTRPATAASPAPTTPTPATRCSTREGVAAEVLFPDADVLGTGRIASSPFGSGLGAGRHRSRAGDGRSQAHNRWLADFCAKQPDRRIGVAVVPILHDIDAAVEPRSTPCHELGPGRRHDPDPVDRRAGVPRSPLRAGVVADRGARPGAAHALRRRARPTTSRARLHGDLRDRGVLVGGPSAVGAALVRRVRAPPRACGTSSPRTARGGCPTSSPRWTRSTSAATTPRSSATSSARTCR